MALSLQPKELQQALWFTRLILFADVLESEMIETAWLASDSFSIYCHPSLEYYRQVYFDETEAGGVGAQPLSFNNNNINFSFNSHRPLYEVCPAYPVIRLSCIL